MTRRIPLWLSLVPLAIGIAAYFWLWSGWAQQFEAAITPWLPGTQVSVGGFPYRLEAEVAAPKLAGGDIVKLTASAARARINRGPWQPDLTVISTEAPRFSAIVGPGIGASLTGKTAMTSVKLFDGKLARLSTVVEAARARLGFSPAEIAADSLEVHVRERLPEAGSPTSPTGPVRGQLVVAGQRLRFDKGDALTFAADLLATGPARLDAYDRWATSGTIEVTALTLADAHGEVAKVIATIVPVGRRTLRFAGTIDTICPQGVAAAFADLPPPAEKRLRAPVRLSFAGDAGAVVLARLPADLALRPVRAQMPACPVLRGRG